jgi:hypothetical protein
MAAMDETSADHAMADELAAVQARLAALRAELDAHTPWDQAAFQAAHADQQDPEPRADA